MTFNLLLRLRAILTHFKLKTHTKINGSSSGWHVITAGCQYDNRPQRVRLACRQLQDEAEGAINDLYFSQRHGFILLVCLLEYESE